MHGDLRTVGMGGATVGLADTFIAAVDNPAGLAMTVGVGDIHYATTTIHDANIQRFSAAPGTDSVGLALGIYPWAVSAGYLSRYIEDASYNLPYLSPKPVELSINTRELILSAARVFAHNRIAVGLALLLGQAERGMSARELKIDSSFASYAAGASLGVTVQLPRRFLLGASFETPQHYSGASPTRQQSLLIPGFFQSVEVPWRASAGLGYIPNRFFRADLTLHVLFETPHTALIRDQNALVGQHITLQPRLGLAYVFADFDLFKATVFAGTYYESSRIAGAESRLHGTFGVEARIWVITFGAGLDFANRYGDYLFSAGVDVFGLLARLQVIPKFWTPPSESMIPPTFHSSDEGLARPLVAHWKPSPRDVDPIKVALAIPKKLGLGLRNAEMDIQKFGDQLAAGMAATNDTPEQKRQRARLAAEALERQKFLQAEAERIAQQAKQAEEAKRADEDEKKKIEEVLKKAKELKTKRRRKHHAKPLPR